MWSDNMYWITWQKNLKQQQKNYLKNKNNKNEIKLTKIWIKINLEIQQTSPMCFRLFEIVMCWQLSINSWDYFRSRKISMELQKGKRRILKTRCVKKDFNKYVLLFFSLTYLKYFHQTIRTRIKEQKYDWLWLSINLKFKHENLVMR